jgi:hypothetical protein
MELKVEVQSSQLLLLLVVVMEFLVLLAELQFKVALAVQEAVLLTGTLMELRLAELELHLQFKGITADL